MKANILPDKVGEIRARFRKKAERVIYRASGFQKRVERNSMLSAPKGEHSPAGTPPYTHPKLSKKGNALPAFPNFIQFKVEEKGFESKSVVGPTKPSKGRRSNWAERIGHTHEFGGTTTVEKRVVYRPVRAGDKILPAPMSGNWTTDGYALFTTKNGKFEHAFNFTMRRTQFTKKKVIFHIRYRAKYPKRPFAAPALRKTIAAIRQGKFE